MIGITCQLEKDWFHIVMYVIYFSEKMNKLKKFCKVL